MPDAFPCDQLNEISLNEELSDRGLTFSWLLDVLWTHCPEFHGAVGKGTVREVTSRDISEGKGYVSNVYKTTLKLVDAPSESFTVMMKVPSTAKLKKFGEDMGADVAANPLANFDVVSAHNVECKVYNFLREAKCLPIAKIWFTQQARDDQVGVILMEDLDEDGINLGHVSALTLQQVKNIVRDFGIFHAHLLCLDAEATKKWQAVQAETNFHLDEFFDFIHHMVAAVPESKEEPFKRLLVQLEPTMTKEFGRYSLLDRPREVRLPLLLCLGDTGAHNMFFKKAPDGTASNHPSAYHDFQIAFAGNQLHDVARILYMFCDAEVRREAEMTLVEDYYTTLADHTNNNGRAVEFGMEQLHEAYALAAVHQALFAVCMCVGLVDMKKADYAPSVYDAWRRKFLLRTRLAVEDAIELLQKFAPQFLAKEPEI